MTRSQSITLELNNLASSRIRSFYCAGPYLVLNLRMFGRYERLDISLDICIENMDYVIVNSVFTVSLFAMLEPIV